MANRFMTGFTCGNNEIVEFIANDENVLIDGIYQLSNGLCITLVSTGETTTSSQTDWFPYGPFETCEECIQPLSGSTGGNGGVVCEVCSGSTFTVDPIKPTYTNEYNKSVEQINAVLIGGNGLNA
jgi:hypothetical protein